jgi:hypothetical protein
MLGVLVVIQLGLYFLLRAPAGAYLRAFATMRLLPRAAA